MSRLPLQALPAFRAVATTQNLRAAAQTLHLTHSAVSQQIRGLEAQLGFQLFDRRGRRVVLNAAGEALLRSVEPALAQLDEGVQAAAAAAGGAAQRLRVTMLPSFAQRWLLPRMGRWRERHPDLALELDATPQPIDLQREGFHAGLRQGLGPWPGLASERLFDAPMPFVVVGSPTAARRLLGAPPEALTREPAHQSLDQSVQAAALALRAARAARRPIAPISSSHRIAGLEAAYAVAELNTQARIAEGRRVLGKKVGLTSRSVQQQLGVDQPDFGMRFDDMELLDGSGVSMQRLMQPSFG